MVLNLFKLVNFSSTTVVTVKNNDNSKDNFTVLPGQSNGHDMWLGHNVSRGVEVCTLFGPIPLGCVFLLWDQDWNLNVRMAMGTTAIPVDHNKDFSINFHEEYAVFECYNGVFKDGIAKVRLYYDGLPRVENLEGDEMMAVLTPLESVDIVDSIVGPSESVSSK